MSLSKDENQQAVEYFREYLRIPSVHPNIDYDDCVAFLRRYAQSVELPVQIINLKKDKPVVVVTWTGTKPNLPSIVLNSHMDVVPVYREKWTHDPFGAYRDKDGMIYGRGTQDMKSVGIQYIEAIRKLKNSNVKLKRTIHVTFVPDEEIGGSDGMVKFVQTSEFQKMNVGFALDEGMASPGGDFILFHGERSIWQIEVHCPGTPGHGSMLMPNTAAEKVRVVLEKFLDFRKAEKLQMENTNNLPGDVTSVNITMLKGGVQNNVVPPEMSVVMDMRLSPSVDHDAFEKTITGWCEEAGPGTYIEFQQKGVKESVTVLDSKNPWWVAFSGAADKLKIDLKPIICPGGTDARYIRRLGIPAIGFSPMNNTPILLHDHNECVHENVFLRGIEIYQKIIHSLGNVTI